jgi:(R,R)-butanediol dehydrogenase / meso-butanediol dehydrogenase / diacetyl reductase
MGCIGLSWAWGGMGEYAIINDYNANTLPESVDDEQGALIEPAAVALYGVERAKVGGGSIVLITGAGPIGALSALASAALGASKIFVSEPNPNRRKQIEALGVTTRAVDPKSVNVVEMLRDETEEGVGVDSAIECSGTEAGLNTCCEAVRNHGTVAQVGLHVKKASVDPALWALKDITVEATWCYHVTMWPRLIGMVERGVYPVHRVITAQIKADDVVDKGFKTLLDPAGNQMKVLVRVA